MGTLAEPFSKTFEVKALEHDTKNDNLALINILFLKSREPILYIFFKPCTSNTISGLIALISVV